MSNPAHWTESSIRDYVYKIASDFLQQIENSLSDEPQNALAERLGVTPGRVSQVLNKPGNLGLRTIVQYARALGMKVAIVAYDDNDPDNVRGPINSQIFEECWARQGRPADFFAFEEADRRPMKTYVIAQERLPIRIVPAGARANSGLQSYGFGDSAGTDADKPRVDRVVPGATTNG